MSTHNGVIPFVDLVRPHLELEQELTGVFQQSLKTASFVGGSLVEGFEQAYAEFCGVEHAVAVSSGTDALRFALMASGVRRGEVVLTVPNTFIATTEAISQAGALPEFIDIDEQTYNMSPSKLRQYLEMNCTRGLSGVVISGRSGQPVTAIVPVHLYGQMADMDGIMQVAEEFGLKVIEDACQAHGARYLSRRQKRWRKAGSVGHAAAFSFYPGKNLGACGEGGAVVTNDPEVAARIRMLRDHGQAQKYYHDMEGYNGRLDAIQAGLLSAKLIHLTQWNQERRERAAVYNRLFAGQDAVITPFEPKWSRAVYHLYVIRTEDRDRLRESLNDAGIHSGIHYPIPLHLQKAYSWLRYGADELPVSVRVASEIVSLPMFPHLTREQQARVVEQVMAFAAAVKRERFVQQEQPALLA